MTTETHDAAYRPKPRAPRRDQWTRRKMVIFLRELAACQSVTQAAKSVGLSRQSAYRLRDRLVGTPFALGWEVALEAGISQLAHAMLDRAINGVEVPHYYQGELIGTSRHYDERLAIWIAANPWKMGRHQMAREYSAEGWDDLLKRIEDGPLDWSGDERAPAATDIAKGDAAQNLASWYGANAANDGSGAQVN
ncbi:hypothetical protein [Croceicoccus mobilis]|uniref:LysR family transcriptional regulator n=1 Tax=Croceicoccus mobilis TaxID=1703339 RepID=A0A916YXQ6_9SPHN|nr:hypothetical protein [Croceicoccus mobilis]GGD66229.1 hypothetical protein GCM10010990_14660 [Croceicoccus mobilis]